MIIFPFRLASEIQSIDFAEDLRVERMSDDIRTKLFGIKECKHDEHGNLLSITYNSPRTSTHIIDFLDELENTHFQASNYILISSSRERAAIFNLALKLAGDSNSFISKGFSKNSAHFINPECNLGKKPLKLNASLIKLIKDDLNVIPDMATDSRFAVMSEIFLNSLSDKIRRSTRLLELAIVLEMLLLPKQTTELSYRFSLRFAIIVNKFFSNNRDESFAIAKRIYKMRSQIAHQGSSNLIDECESVVLEYTRKLLRTYIHTPNIFTDKEFDNLVLNGQ